jgi:hypothetical protein
MNIQKRSKAIHAKRIWSGAGSAATLDRGDVMRAVVSMGSDLAKHKELAGQSMIRDVGLSYAMNNDLAGARRWVKGFR